MSPRYITPEGQQAMKDELQLLWSVTRPEVTRKVTEAAAMGDRSENAEYIYGKRQLRQIDARVRFLSKRLEALVVVQRPPSDQSRVYFGAWVSVEDDQGSRNTYRLVGSDEFDPARRYISIDSPIARALMGKASGDEIAVHAPEGERYYRVCAVAYGAPGDAVAAAGTVADQTVVAADRRSPDSSE